MISSNQHIGAGRRSAPICCPKGKGKGKSVCPPKGRAYGFPLTLVGLRAAATAARRRDPPGAARTGRRPGAATAGSGDETGADTNTQGLSHATEEPPPPTPD